MNKLNYLIVFTDHEVIIVYLLIMSIIFLIYLNFHLFIVLSMGTTLIYH